MIRNISLPIRGCQELPVKGISSPKRIPLFFPGRPRRGTQSEAISMNRILVAIQKFSWLSLSASYFAITFAERNPTKVLFLIFSSASEGEDSSSQKQGEEAWRRKFDSLIQQAREEKIQLELFRSNDEYLEAVSQFSRDHNPTEIILGLPQVQDPAYHRLMREVEARRNQVENRIVIVKPKEEPETDDCQESTSRDPYPQRSGTLSEKKGL
jgi:hypothetical protein